MKSILTTVGFTGLVFLGSCGVQQGVSASTETRCLLDNRQQQLAWTPVVGEDTPDLQQQLGTARLPSRYLVFRLNQDSLVNCFRQWRADPADTVRLALPLPETPYCMEFNMIASGTLSDALSRKYPELVSLKGVATDGRRADARIDFDGKHLKAEMRLHYKTYILSAWPTKEEGETETVYLLYLKTDSGVERKPLRQD